MGSGSLAAESYREGGDFASNSGVHSENQSASDYNTSSGTTQLEAVPDTENRKQAHDTSSYEGQLGSGGRSQDQSSAGTAPSYVSNQYARDSSGPHGKNIHEGFDDAGVRDGLKAALASEPGSKDDPSRLAEKQFEQSQNSASRAGGPRQTGLATESQYDVLKDSSA